MTNFALDANDFSQLVTQVRAAGGTSLILDSVAGLAAPSGSAFYRLTIADATTGDILVHLKVTGVDSGTNTLTIAGTLDGFSDPATIPIGARAYISASAGTLSDIQAAINTAETTLAGLGTASTHAASDFATTSALAAAITGLSTVYAPIVHTHAGADIVSGTVAAARLPAFVGSGSSHAPGIVPDPGASAGTTKFLREDATFAVPAGGGGMAIGGSVTSGTAGSILFLGSSGILAQDNTNLHWDDSAQTLNLGATGKLAGGDITWNLAGGLSGPDLNWNSGEVFRLASFGNPDLFMQGLPQVVGHFWIECYGGLGLILGTGQATPVAFKPNRVIVANVRDSGTIFEANAQAATDIPIVAQGAASQSADLFQAQNNTPAVVWRVRADGSVGLPHLADSAAVNDSLYLSSTSGKLTYKDSSGGLHVST